MPAVTLDEIITSIRIANPVPDYCAKHGLKLSRESKFLCPFHNDGKNPNCHAYPEHFHCFSCGARGSVIDLHRKLHNCDFKEACRHFGHDVGGIEFVAVYPYLDEAKAEAYQIVRKPNGPDGKKNFLIRYRQGGNWVWRQPARIIPYHLDEVVAGHDEIWIVEGEKDAETLRRLHLVATCCPFGAGKWPSAFAQYFKGRKVVICPDNDEPGEDHCLKVGQNLSPVAASVRVLQLPGLGPKEDVTDFFEKDRATFAERLDDAYKEAKPFADFQHGTNGEKQEKPKNEVGGKPIFDYRGRQPSPEDTLLGNRFLCRKGGLLFVGPSGMGKSSASVQQDIQWCMGRVSFGIRPSRPLRIVTVQAEDDEGDIHEMVSGVCKFLNVTPEDEELYRDKCIYVTCRSLTFTKFIDFLRKVLTKYRPDILRINPLQAYLGADIKDPEKTAEFLRAGINGLLEEFNCAVIVVHHTPKTNFRDTEDWMASDWMYAGAGSADITNWARAILIADPTDSPYVFRWIAAKRGRRIGWADSAGEPAIERYFSHAEGNGIHWDETPAGEIPKKGGKKNAARPYEQDKVMALIPAAPLEIFRGELLDKIHNQLDVGIVKAKEWIAILLETAPVELIKKPRPGTKPAEFIRRRE